VNLIEWTDEDGLPHLSWLPEGQTDGQMGIPHDPPYPDKLGLSRQQERALYAALVRRQLVTWRDEAWLRSEIEQAIRGADGLTPTPQLAGLVMTIYADRKVVKPLWTRVNWHWVLDNLDISDEQRRCVVELMTAAKIETLADVENAPARTGHICGLDIYQLVAHVLAWA